MGFVGFLNFGLKCIQLLAWPSLALGYPLCASIRAIETNSNYHMRKLVTYWILFSLISLFEHAFGKLIEWIPFWPFLKTIAISCLVLHRFTGAYYAYKWLVRLLSVNLWKRFQDINWLNKKVLSLKRETFLAAAERYLDENGTEALEKLIASKSNSKARNVAQNDINTVEHEEKEAATDKISNNKAPNVAQNDINTVEHEENAAATDKIQSNSKAPNVAQNDINTVEHEENVAATDKISNIKALNVAQNDIITVEHEENAAATDKIQPNNKAPNVAQNDINAMVHEENVIATDKIQPNSKAPNVAQNDINTVEHEENVAATDKISNSEARNVAHNDINTMEHEENAAVTDKISNNKVPNVAQNDINTVEPEENAAATDKIQSNNKAPNVAQNDTNAVEHEENVAVTDKIQSNSKAPNVAHNDMNAVELVENVAVTDKIQSNIKEPNAAQNDINTLEPEENVAATFKIDKHVDTNFLRTQQKLGTSTEVKEVTSATTVREYVLPVPRALRIQKVWSCTVCQVKTSCEVTHNSHLQGRKHKSKCKEASKQAMKVQGSSSTTSNQEPKKTVSGNRLAQNKTQKAEEQLKVDVNEQWKPGKPANAAAVLAAGIRESKYWNGMHNVSCPGEIDMAAHLIGRRHLSLLEEFDGNLRVPNYGAMVPQTFEGMPNYGAMVPPAFEGVPNYGAMVPRAFEGLPNYGAMVPRAFEGLPNYGAMVPQASEGVTNYGAMVPQASEGVPNYDSIYGSSGI